jgi:hypothetical protein
MICLKAVSIHTSTLAMEMVWQIVWQGLFYGSRGKFMAKGLVRSPDGCSDSALLNLEVLPHPSAAVQLMSSDEQCFKGHVFTLEDQSVFCRYNEHPLGNR